MKSTPAAGQPSPEPTCSIGELAARFGLATHVLRHWESVGLLTPAARVGGRRRYTQSHIARVALILHSKQVGLGLARTRDLLDACDGPGRRSILRAHLNELDVQLARIQTSKNLINHVLTCRYEDFTECPRFRAEIAATAGIDRE
ncbi:MerR family transcriptional regulator [Nocardia sp. NPDC050799]|uniref:helix-turn-helix domain-containing protein n=1 Tax=Nocardia sp. NPDC050799 TaxID=3154842 RepID=UPI0033E7DACD